MSDIFYACQEDEDMRIPLNTDFKSAFDEPAKDFVKYFPPELSNKLFTYLNDKDIFTCSRCSYGWRQVINNNIQWKLRCIRKGWFRSDGDTNPFRWSDTLSHVGKGDLQFRQSPLFHLPPVASMRIEPLCDWAQYYRQSYHREKNWKQGRYVIHKFKIPEQVIPAVYNCCSCNGKIFAVGTTIGYIIMWSVIGRPRHLKTIMAVQKGIEVEHLHLTDNHMVVLCQTGLLQCYSIHEDSQNGIGQCEIIFLLKIGGSYNDKFTYSFQINKISVNQMANIYHYQLGESQVEENILEWIHVLYGETNTPWLENEYMVSDMFLSVRDQKIIMSGINSNGIYIWDIHTGSLTKCLILPPNVQVCYKTFLLHKRNIYLSVRRVFNQNQLHTLTYHLLIYDLLHVLKNDNVEYSEYESPSMLEEVCADSEEKRLVWVSQDSLIVGKDIERKKTLFTKQGQSYIDNLTVYEDLVIYHQYDGLIIAIDWNGVPIYQVEMRLGIVRGLKCCGQFLISGGDAKNLSIWNCITGQPYHKVHHQPCRIEHVYADETKVITLGREDPPVLIGYW